jgi:O-antigen/teichoic acid export membrane protein
MAFFGDFPAPSDAAKDPQRRHWNRPIAEKARPEGRARRDRDRKPPPPIKAANFDFQRFQRLGSPASPEHAGPSLYPLTHRPRGPLAKDGVNPPALCPAAMTAVEKIEGGEEIGLTDKVRGAVLWRSGSQIAAQLVTWTATFVVIRLLTPADYGLFAMTQVVLMFLSLMNGYGFANALVRSERVTPLEIRQMFGLLILLNGALALAQFALAPLAAAYFRQPAVETLLRVQVLLYAATPFIALPQALLSRRIDFRGQALVSMLSAGLSAATALGCAAAGLGVWTLVAAPLVLFWSQGIGLTWAARSLVWPSFRFKGAGHHIRYGGAMVAIQCFWFIQSQSDVFIAGRIVAPHALGLYTTSLFLTQIVAGKFVPPVNEVSFAAYSRIQDRRDALAAAFLKTVRLVMLIALPFYFGLATTAEPVVLTVLGWKWAETVPLVRALALAMPFLTLQILFAPATNALGRPRAALRVAMAGAAIMPACFLIGSQYGTIGLARAWLVGFPLLTATTVALSLPVIGASLRGLARAVLPGLAASAVMAAVVAGADAALPAMAPAARMGILAATGLAVYAGLLVAFARPLVEEVAALLLRREPPAAAQAL